MYTGNLLQFCCNKERILHLCFHLSTGKLDSTLCHYTQRGFVVDRQSLWSDSAHVVLGCAGYWAHRTTKSWANGSRAGIVLLIALLNNYIIHLFIYLPLNLIHNVFKVHGCWTLPNDTRALNEELYRLFGEEREDFAGLGMQLPSSDTYEETASSNSIYM